MLNQRDDRGDQTQFASPATPGRDASQQVSGSRASSYQEPHSECSQSHQRDGEKREQAGPGINAFHASLGESEIPFDVAEAFLNGLIINDKFCLSRRHELNLTWWRRPLKLRSLSQQ
ncbi:MAG: hypothetical protein SF339_08610 [Blastocatellia bacterium]|nr:hypothetical protein [Blastocatellia bacterium]